MDDKIKLSITEDYIQDNNSKKIVKKGEKKWIIFLVIGLVMLCGGIGCFAWAFLRPQPEAATLTFPTIPSKKADEKTVYSNLTGEVLADASLLNAPTFCIQTPNGTDGARPQAGLNTAGVIFEAIAESGITRFAAIYQNPTAAVIGPIRSLRIYYLEWDTPFNCTIVHAGGADDAIAAVRAGGYRDLTENYAYMYRGTYQNRRWNNLFTTSTLLKQFNSDRGFSDSSVKGFARLTPEESSKTRVDSLIKEPLNIIKPSQNNTSELVAKVGGINLRFGGWGNFNIHYDYDANTNRYLRSYESGTAHEVYSCPEGDLGEKNPEDVCTLTQMAPSVVVAMVVRERKASDNYHESIDAIGSGDVYVFQNGTAVKGTWKKTSREEQITFTAEDGSEIELAPGQTIVSAIPTYGSVDF